MTANTQEILAERIRESTEQIEAEREDKRAARAARLKHKEALKKTAKIERLAGLFLLIGIVLLGAIIQLIY